MNFYTFIQQQLSADGTWNTATTPSRSRQPQAIPDIQYDRDYNN